jgi:predicted nuclease of predicted toxin-antitoxin system
MRLLLDESVPSRLRRALPNHAVRTVGEMGWSGVKNGKLLALAANDFDAFITVDKNLPYQQNLRTLPIAVVVLDAGSIELPALLPLVPALELQLASLKAKTYVRVQPAHVEEGD